MSSSTTHREYAATRFLEAIVSVAVGRFIALTDMIVVRIRRSGISSVFLCGLLCRSGSRCRVQVRVDLKQF
jgi:hypothetical protein